MAKSSITRGVVLAICCAGLVSFHSLSADEKLPPVIRSVDEPTETESGEAFMLGKLAATHRIVDGLAFEDFARIEQGADELLRIADLAAWKVRRDPLYMHYSTDFEGTALRLRDAARNRNIEQATFAYLHLNVSCMACHRHVRHVVHVAPVTESATAGDSAPIRR